MSETQYRAGILLVSPPLAGRARVAIPPEHRVAAVRDDPYTGCERWLVEGPRMPLVPGSGTPNDISIVLTMSGLGHDACEVHLDAALADDQEHGWHVGTWPNWATFQGAFSR
jgi:hypothetical protein